MTFGRLWFVIALAAGCAKGGTVDETIDASTAHHDAHPQNVIPDASTAKDAPVSLPDAAVAIDAAVLGPDASTDGMICTANAMCTDSGECCVSISGVGICAKGVIIGATCLPQ